MPTFRFTPAGDPAAAAAAGAARGLRLAAELVLQEARTTAPIAEGTLERSGRVTTDDDHHVTVGFYTPYAARQHEDLTYRHAPGRHAKYLEQAVTRSRARAQAILAEQLRRALT